jgi:hypothetical protein
MAVPQTAEALYFFNMEVWAIRTGACLELHRRQLLGFVRFCARILAQLPHFAGVNMPIRPTSSHLVMRSTMLRKNKKAAGVVHQPLHQCEALGSARKYSCITFSFLFVAFENSDVPREGSTITTWVQPHFLRPSQRIARLTHLPAPANCRPCGFSPWLLIPLLQQAVSFHGRLHGCVVHPAASSNSSDSAKEIP